MPTFENPLQDEPVFSKEGKGRIFVYERYAHLCEKTQVVDLTKKGHLIAVNTQLAAIKALVCARPEISKLSTRDGAHPLSGMNLEPGIGYYELRELERSLKEQQAIQSNTPFDPDKINDLPTQGVVFSEAHYQQLVGVDFTECAECEGIAIQLGEAYLVQKMTELGLDKFTDKLADLSVSMNQSVKEHPLYVECVENNNKRQDTLDALTADPKIIPPVVTAATEKDKYKLLAVDHYYKIQQTDQISEVDPLTGVNRYNRIVEHYSPSRERSYDECPTCNNYLYLVIQFKQECDCGPMPAAIKALYDRAQESVYTKRQPLNSSHAGWRTPDLTLTLTNAEWEALALQTRLDLENFLVSFAWVEAPIYQNFTYTGGKTAILSAFEICKMNNCKPACEACNSVWDPANPQKPEYIACYVKNCLTYTCDTCPECLNIARDFGADSDAYRECYRQNKTDPCEACKPTLDSFGRSSVEYLQCVEANCQPIGKHSQAQWEVSKVSTAYSLSMIKDLLGGSELCIECCTIDRQAHPEKYLECVSLYCMNSIPDFLCSADKIDVALIDSLPKAGPTFPTTPMDSINSIPFMDSRLIAKVQNNSSVRILEASKLVVIDDVSYYQDKLELLDSGKVVTKRTRIFSPQDAIDAIGMDALSQMPEEEADEAIAAYVRDSQDLTFLLKNPGEAEEIVSSVQFDSRCAALKEVLTEQPWPEPVKMDDCVLEGNCLTCTSPTLIKKLCREGDCYSLEVTNRITLEVSRTVSCEEPRPSWDDDRIRCFKVLSKIEPAAIQRLLDIDDRVKSLLNKLNIPQDQRLDFVKKNLVCKNPELAEYLQNNPETPGTGSIVDPIKKPPIVPPPINSIPVSKISKATRVPSVTINQTPLVESHIVLPASGSLSIETSPDLLRDVVQQSEEMRRKTLEHLKRSDDLYRVTSDSFLNRVRLTIWIPEKSVEGYVVDEGSFDISPILNPLKVLGNPEKYEEPKAPATPVIEPLPSPEASPISDIDTQDQPFNLPKEDKPKLVSSYKFSLTPIQPEKKIQAEPQVTLPPEDVVRISKQVSQIFTLPDSVQIKVAKRADTRNQVVVSLTLDFDTFLQKIKEDPVFAKSVPQEEIKRMQTLQSIALYEIRLDMLFTRVNGANNITILYNKVT